MIAQISALDLRRWSSEALRDFWAPAVRVLDGIRHWMRHNAPTQQRDQAFAGHGDVSPGPSSLEREDREGVIVVSVPAEGADVTADAADAIRQSDYRIRNPRRLPPSREYATAAEALKHGRLWSGLVPDEVIASLLRHGNRDEMLFLYLAEADQFINELARRDTSVIELERRLDREPQGPRPSAWRWKLHFGGDPSNMARVLVAKSLFEYLTTVRARERELENRAASVASQNDPEATYQELVTEVIANLEIALRSYPSVGSIAGATERVAWLERFVREISSSISPADRSKR